MVVLCVFGGWVWCLEGVFWFVVVVREVWICVLVGVGWELLCEVGVIVLVKLIVICDLLCWKLCLVVLVYL